VLIGAVAATADAGAGGGVGLVGAGLGGGFGFGRVVAVPYAVKAVAEPRATAIPTEGASELPSVAGAGLVRAGHALTVAPSGIGPLG
jgi:hypothetical protein